MNLPERKPIRLKGYSYSQSGAYFITICTKNREKILSDIVVGCGVYDAPQITLTAYGKIAENYIHLMNDKYDTVSIDKYVIMPNHIHFIIVIRDNAIGGSSLAPNPTNEIIPKFVSLYKRYCNRACGRNIWQKSYHDHIIRGETDYREIWGYIDNNPAKWQEDRFYTQ